MNLESEKKRGDFIKRKILGALISTMVLLCPIQVQAQNKAQIKAQINNTLKETYEMLEQKYYENIKLEEFDIVGHSGIKTYESYRLLTAYTQKDLQDICQTDDDGLRLYDDRFCVAVGTAFNMSVGQYFDVELSNGFVIKCIVGDIKADQHTDSQNIFTKHNGCCTEFIVDSKKLPKCVKTMGDISTLCEDFDAPVVKIITYDYNILEERSKNECYASN